MRLSIKKVLDIPIIIAPKETVLEEIRKYFKNVKCQMSNVKCKGVNPFVIFTPNPEIIAYAQKDEEFKRIIVTGQINIPDGWGIIWAIKKLYGVSTQRLSGADLFFELASYAEKEGLRIGLIGGRQGIALKVAKCLSRSYKNLLVEVLGEPEIRLESRNNSKTKYAHDSLFIMHDSQKQPEQTKRYFNQLAHDIVKSRIDILFVALGFPKQEYFIENVKCQMSNVKCNRPLVLMGVGGTFDFVAGRIGRAPLWMRNLGIEWLYRLLREPGRIGRQLAGAEFFLKILLHES